MIVFPHEKTLLEQLPNNRLPFRDYVPRIRSVARGFAAMAKEIRIIGYSCPETDFPDLQALLDAAQSCERVIIQSPEAKSICERLRCEVPNKARLFEASTCTFEDAFG